jgi:putative transposase
VYNKYVEGNLKQKKLIGYNQATSDLLLLKAEYEWLKEVSSITLQQTLKDATQGVKNFFKNPKKFNPPKYKKRGNRQSFRIVGENSFSVKTFNAEWSGVKLPKMGYLKFRTERVLPGKPTSVTVVRTPSGEYYVSFVVEVTTQPLPPTEQVTAIDLGLKNYGVLVTNTGSVEELPNPRYYRRGEKKLARLQQALSSKKKGSKNRDKARLRVAKQHQKVSNQRKDFINKLVSRLVNENQVIITETLKPANMAKNHTLAKSIMDAGWGTFLTQLSNKAVMTGRTHILIDQYYPSTKTCNKCGTIRDGLTLADRSWVCDCGTSHDRDLNAALNILAAGSAERLNALNQETGNGNYATELTKV